MVNVIMRRNSLKMHISILYDRTYRNASSCAFWDNGKKFHFKMKINVSLKFYLRVAICIWPQRYSMFKFTTYALQIWMLHSVVHSHRLTLLQLWTILRLWLSIFACMCAECLKFLAACVSPACAHLKRQSTKSNKINVRVRSDKEKKSKKNNTIENDDMNTLCLYDRQDEPTNQPKKKENIPYMNWAKNVEYTRKYHDNSKTHEKHETTETNTILMRKYANEKGMKQKKKTQNRFFWFVPNS